MSYTLNRIAVGQVGILPGSVKMITTDSLATITTAGYLNGVGNQLPTVEVAPSDVIECLYSYNSVTDSGTLAFFQPTISNGVITLNLWENPGNVLLPVVSGDFAVFNGTTGQIKDAGYSASDPAKTIVAMVGSAVVLNRIAHFSDIAGTIDDTAAAVTNAGDIYAGLSGTSGQLRSYPGTAANGYLALLGINAGGAFNTIISNSVMGQSSTISIPDPGAATAKFLLDTGTNNAGTFTTMTATTANITNLKYGATPVAQVDPASCTITAVAGAANTSTITVQLKDGSGTNMTRIIPFRVYSSSAADGLTLQSAASTGYSVASGGLSLNNGAAITTQINCISSATGGCVLSLLDTGKQTSYLVLVLANGTKISAQLSAGSYG
jgi:hypothetical protein